MERIVIKFIKNKEAKFISHLDLMRTLNRALRRAGISVTYSKGFNPHASISLAAPLSLGTGSEAEYGDIEVDCEVDEEYITEGLNCALPEGIRVLKTMKVQTKLPPVMALVEAAQYSISLMGGIEESEASDLIKSILSETEINKMKKTKTGEKIVDIRPMIFDLKNVGTGNNKNVFECLVATGSRANLNPEILAEVIKEYSGGNLKGYAEIIRQELFTQIESKWAALDSFIQEK